MRLAERPHDLKLTVPPPQSGHVGRASQFESVTVPVDAATALVTAFGAVLLGLGDPVVGGLPGLFLCVVLAHRVARRCSLRANRLATILGSWCGGVR